MPTDSWEAWDREDFNKEELEFLKELEQWAEYAADTEIEVSPDFHDRLMESIREQRTLLIKNQEPGLTNNGDDDISTRPSLPISMLNVGESYQTCRQSGCGYQVKPSDEFCPNCGIVSPAQDQKQEPNHEPEIKAVSEILRLNGELKFEWEFGTIISYLAFWPFYICIFILAKAIKVMKVEGKRKHKKSYEEAQESYDKRHESFMINKENTIKEYLHNIDIQEPKIRERLAETPYEISQQMLRAALKKIPNLRRQCQDKLCEIELTRWHNRVMSVYENSLNLSESAYNSRIEQSARVREEGGEILDRWEASYSGQMESSERLGRALDICRRFHRDLMILRDEVIAGQIISIEEELARFEHSADYSERMAEIEAFILISDFDDFQERLELEELNKELNHLLSEYT